MSLSKERAIVTPGIISKRFRDMKAHVNGQDPTLLSDLKRLYKSDETGFSFDAMGRKVVAFKGSKHVYAVSANTRPQVTVLATMSAAGHYLPPMLIYPYKRIPRRNLLEGFPDAVLQISDNGWITGAIFHAWLRDIFVPQTMQVEKP